jgi:anti-sigma factor RsiW
MPCEDRDENLLLLAHGELPALRRGLTRLHLNRCPRCRERQEQLEAVSRVLAGALWRTTAPGGPSAPAARLTQPAGMAARRPSPAIVVALAVLLSLMALAGVLRFAATHDGPAPRAAQPAGADDGCRPDLNNDRCR